MTFPEGRALTLNEVSDSLKNSIAQNDGKIFGAFAADTASVNTECKRGLILKGKRCAYYVHTFSGVQAEHI